MLEIIKEKKKIRILGLGNPNRTCLNFNKIEKVRWDGVYILGNDVLEVA